MLDTEADSIDPAVGAPDLHADGGLVGVEVGVRPGCLEAIRTARPWLSR
jgi:hypothetical protein